MFKGHIVFDCDGTLISSAHLIFPLVAEILTEQVGRPFTAEQVQENFDADIEVMYNNLGISDSATLEKIYENWVQKAHLIDGDYQVFPGIEELLQELQREGFGLYIWTARDRLSMEKVLKQLDILKYFIDWRTGTDGAVKPHPQGLEELIGSEDKKKVIMIGDSYTDILGAKAVGVYGVGCTWCPNTIVSQLEEHQADAIVHKVSEFRSVINGVFKE